MNLSARERFFKRFGTRKVFIVHAICLFITIVTMLYSIISTLIVKERTTEKMVEHLALCFLAILLLNIPIFMRTKLNYHIPAFLHIIVAVFIIAHLVLGEIYRFYDYIFAFDKVLHATAGVVIGGLGYSIVYGFSKTKSGAVRLSPFFISLFSFCFALALLVLWEVFEYSIDCFFGLNAQRWQDGLSEIIIDGKKYFITSVKQGSGLVDTMSDLIVGVVGAAIICLAGGLLLKKYPEGTRFYVTKNRRQEGIRPQNSDKMSKLDFFKVRREAQILAQKTDIERAKWLLLAGKNTCTLIKGDFVYSTKARGISPMVDHIDLKTDLKGFSVADRVVGKAAALLFVLAGIAEVYAEILSKQAQAVLNNHNIKCSYATLTDKILNRDATDVCPMEKAVEGIDQPSEALKAIKEKLDFLKNLPADNSSDNKDNCNDNNL